MTTGIISAVNLARDDADAYRAARRGHDGLMRIQICEAIRRKRLLMFGYGDLVRVVEPHLFGVNNVGHEMPSAWLRPGHSRTDPEGGWRNYLTSEITNLQMLDETFAGPCEGFNRRDPRMREVFCVVETAVAGAGSG